MLFQNNENMRTREKDLKDIYSKNAKTTPTAGREITSYIKCSGPVHRLEKIQLVFGLFTYDFKCLTDAIDTHFKLAKVFGKCFAPAAKPMFQFLSRNVYKIPVAEVGALVTDFEISLARVLQKKPQNSQVNKRKGVVGLKFLANEPKKKVVRVAKKKNLENPLL